MRHCKTPDLLNSGTWKHAAGLQACSNTPTALGVFCCGHAGSSSGVLLHLKYGNAAADTSVAIAVQTHKGEKQSSMRNSN